MNAQRPVWLILPVVLTAMSFWLIAVRTSASRQSLGIVIVLCILGCVRQAFHFWTKGQKAYATVMEAMAVMRTNGTGGNGGNSQGTGSQGAKFPAGGQGNRQMRILSTSSSVISSLVRS